MFGFVIAIACLIGLWVVVRRGRRHRFYGGSGRWHERYWLNQLFDRLGTSNAQEKLILAAVGDVQEQVHSVRGGLRATRSKLASALRDDRLDSEQLSSTLASHEGDMTALRQRLVTLLATVHETLDPEQRQKLARLIDEGFHVLRSGHCHRAYAG